MSLLTANDLAKEFGPDEIFSGVSVEIPHGARIAMVGPNGAGKTTLLNILIGLDIPSAGMVNRARGVKIGFLPQRPELLGEHTLREELYGAFADLQAMEFELEQLAEAMAQPNPPDRLIARYGELQEKFEAGGGYTYDQRAKTVIQGLGFALEDQETKLSELSGGQKTRAVLGRLLLEEPTLLALDEPTNHLDINAIAWLEGYLKEFPGAVLVVSHDRYFMDAVAQTIWEMDFGTIEIYRGNYSHYTTQREERYTRRWKEFEAQQAFIAKEEEYIRRNLAGQNVSQAKGRRTRLERLRKDGLVQKPRTRQNMSLNMKAQLRSGELVLRTLGLHVGYPGKPLFAAPNITLRRGEVAALIGPNGAGKSTFIKTVVEQLAPLQGEVKLGAAVNIGYFAQAHESLNPKSSILDEILNAKNMAISEARHYLGRFMFSGDDVFRTISTLSGGERGRVALAKLALSGSNFLMLDEPTNHLDIASQEQLQNVLADFPGTILVVSHDRYLIDALATQIWEVSAGSLLVFEGTYQEYLASKQRQAELATAEASAARAREKTGGANGKGNGGVHPSGLNAYQRQKRVAVLEKLIPELEARMETIIADLGVVSISGDAARARTLGEAYTRTEQELHDTMTEWESIVD